MNDLQEEHCPSLQPCMSMMPCSAAARRTFWSSSTSISMPTGSNRTTCFSPMTPSELLKGGRLWAADERANDGVRSEGSRTKPQTCGSLAGQTSVVDREPAAGAATDVPRVEGRPLLRRHLVEQDVRALHRRHPAQVVQRPHLLLVTQLQVRLRHHGLAVVADEAHVGHHVGPVPAVVERLPLT